LGGLFKSLEGLQRGSAAAVGDLDALSAGVRRASESTKAMSDALGRISASSAAIDLDSVRAGLAQVGDRLQSLGASATSAEQRYVAASETAIGSMRSKTEDLTEATRRLSDAFVAVANELTQSTTIISDALK
jgi:hypothetical protein